MFNYISTILYFMTNNEKKRLLLLFLLMLFSAFVELAGVGSIFPYIKILSSPQIIHSNDYLKATYSFFHFSSDRAFMVSCGAVIFSLIVLKGAVTFLNNFAQAKFTYSMNNRLSEICLDRFLSMPYQAIVSSNSSVLSKHLLYDVRNLISVVTAMLTVSTNLVVALALIALMIWVDPFLVLTTMLALAGFMWLSMRVTKRLTKKLSKENEFHNRQVYKIANESLAGVKDIKTFGVKQYFINLYNTSRAKLSSQAIAFQVISTLPTTTMNVIGFGVLLTVLLYLLFVKGSLLTVLPVIAIIAVCIQRLLPAVTAMTPAITNIRKYRSAVYVVYDKFAQEEGFFVDPASVPAVNGIRFQNQLKFEDVCFRYDASDRNALDKVSFTIRKNQSVGIVGPSGAGKSTLVDVLTGLLKIDSGKIYFDNSIFDDSMIPVIPDLIGYVPQQTFLFDTTLEENIAFGVEKSSLDYVSLSNAIKIAQLGALIDQLPEGLNTRIGEKGVKISGGQRQRVGIARALYRKPSILIMDEATNALDSVTEAQFNESLKSLIGKMTLIVIAHRFSSIKFCDTIFVFDEGKLIERGSYMDLKGNARKFNELYSDQGVAW